MNKWIGLLLFLAVACIGYLLARDLQFVPEWNKPKFAKINRGDIRVPISASGLIEPKQLVDVKSEASGEVLEVRVREGDFVHSGDVLVMIKPDDEKRSVDRAEADLARSKALLAQAVINVDEAKVNQRTAEARLRELESQAQITEYNRDKVRALLKKNQSSEQEVNDAEARHDITLAQIEQANAAIASAKLSISTAEEQVKINEANVAVSERNLGDAQERLEETTIIATADGIVTDVFVTPGTLIQSATATFTGGTTLLQIGDISELKVVARVDETAYGRVLAIAPGAALPQVPELIAAAEQSQVDIELRSGIVQLTVDPFPEEIFEGRIDRVEPRGKLPAGSSVIQFDVHIVVTDENRFRLPLGCQAQVEFTVDAALDVLRVPADAVKSQNDQRGLWLRTEPDSNTRDLWGKRFVPVIFGITDGNYTEVIRALGDETIEEGAEVYIKLPTIPEDE